MYHTKFDALLVCLNMALNGVIVVILVHYLPTQAGELMLNRSDFLLMAEVAYFLALRPHQIQQIISMQIP